MPEIAFDSARLASLYALGLVAAFAVGAVAVHVVLSVIASRRREDDDHSLAASMLTTLKGPLTLFLVTLGLLLGFQALASSSDDSLSWLADYREWALRVWLVAVALMASYLATHLLESLSLWYLENVAERTSSDLDDRIMAQVRRFRAARGVLRRNPAVDGPARSLDHAAYRGTWDSRHSRRPGAAADAGQPVFRNISRDRRGAKRGRLRGAGRRAVGVRGGHGLAEHEDQGPVQQHDHDPELASCGQHPHELLQLLEGDDGAGGVRGELRV